MADGAIAARSSPPAAAALAGKLSLVPSEATASGGGARHGRYSSVSACSHDGAPGTCQQRGCRYHLAHRGYSEHQLIPTRDCALDVANEGPHTREEIAVVLGISDESLRKIEKRAITRLKRNQTLRRLHDESF